MITGEFVEEFRILCGSEIGLGMMEADEGIGAGMEDEEGDFQAGEFVDGVVMDGADPFDREEREEFGADGWDAGESALEDQSAEGCAEG